MKRKSGFLLIELMFSLVALSFMLCLFGQFFSAIVNWHREARDRLDMLLTMQNHIEKMWQGALQQSLKKDNDQMMLSYVDLPLPHIDNLILPKLKYGMLEYRTSAKSIVMRLPGYIYEAT